jgi:hypothetical protein
MPTLARQIYLDSEFGVPNDLQGAGTALENPFVYDSVAQDLKSMADQGLVEVVKECVVQHASERLILRLTFRRVR